MSFRPLIRTGVLLVLFLLALSSRSRVIGAAGSIPISELPPRLSHEFRGAWIATVSNIDWPSKPGLAAAEQQSELRALMDKARELNLNALILQVRPACDAIYRSPLEPWSEFITGRMGEAPRPFYDPLEFAIREAHARGLELHAWFNPFRAGWARPRPVSSRHVSKTHPNWTRQFEKYLWLDPGEPAVRDYVTRVILDVVQRYDLDGVHLDDYFYPYAENGTDFPDSTTWRRYRAAGGKLSRADWRRDNINRFVRRLQGEIHRRKSWVTFGISPFGIWRPGFPSTVRGRDAFDTIYADARLWLANGWVDYLAPQLYWRIGSPEQSFAALFDWWRRQSVQGIPVWPGGAITSVGNWPAEEIVRQIQHTRSAPSPGYIHWNMSALMKNPNDLQRHLLDRLYAEPALIPPNRGDARPTQKPVLNLGTNGPVRTIQWSPAPNQDVSLWVLQTKTAGEWKTEILPKTVRAKELPAKVSSVAITAVSRHRNPSPQALRTF